MTLFHRDLAEVGPTLAGVGDYIKLSSLVSNREDCSFYPGSQTEADRFDLINPKTALSASGVTGEQTLGQFYGWRGQCRA